MILFIYRFTEKRKWVRCHSVTEILLVRLLFLLVHFWFCFLFCYYFNFSFSFAFVVVRCRCYVEKMSSRFNVLSYTTPTLNRTAHIQPTTTIMCKVHFEILCLHAIKLELFLFWRHHNAPHHVRLHLQAWRVPKAVLCLSTAFRTRSRCWSTTRKVRTPLLARLSKAVLSHHSITIACRIEGVYAALLLPVPLMAANDHRAYTAGS